MAYGDENEDPQSLSKKFALGLGSLLGGNAASAPLEEMVAPTQTPAPAPSSYSKPLPLAAQPQPQMPPQVQPQGGGSISDQIKMALIPLGTALLGGLAGGNKGAMIGAQSGLQGVGNEVQKQEQRDAAAQQLKLKEQEQKNLIAETYRQKSLLEDVKSDNKNANKDAKTGHYTDDNGDIRIGTLDPKTGQPIRGDDDALYKAKKDEKDPYAMIDYRDQQKQDAEKRKNDRKIQTDFGNAMNTSRGRGAGEMGKLQHRLNQADYALGILLDEDGNPRKLWKGEATEAGSAVGALVSGGSVAAQHSIDQMTPSTLAGDFDAQWSYLTGHMTPADLHDFVETMANTAKREQRITKKQLAQAQLGIIGSADVHEWRQDHPAEWARQVKMAGFDPKDFDEDSNFIGKLDKGAKPVSSAGGGQPPAATAPDISKMTRQQKIDELKAAGVQ